LADDVVFRLQSAVEETVPTLLVTRESQETGNVFHVVTDLFNAFITLRMLRWDSGFRQVQGCLAA